MAFEKIVLRVASGHSCCPKCRNTEIPFEDELAPVECSKCGWKGVCRELAFIPVDLNPEALRLIAANHKFYEPK